jgi:hypothetical protein
LRLSVFSNVVYSGAALHHDSINAMVSSYFQFPSVTNRSWQLARDMAGDSSTAYRTARQLVKADPSVSDYWVDLADLAFKEGDSAVANSALRMSRLTGPREASLVPVRLDVRLRNWRFLSDGEQLQAAVELAEAHQINMLPQLKARISELEPADRKRLAALVIGLSGGKHFAWMSAYGLDPQ